MIMNYSGIQCKCCGYYNSKSNKNFICENCGSLLSEEVVNNVSQNSIVKAFQPHLQYNSNQGYNYVTPNNNSYGNTYVSNVGYSSSNYRNNPNNVIINVPYTPIANSNQMVSRSNAVYGETNQPASGASVFFASLGIIALTLFTMYSNEETRIESIVNWISMIMTAGLTIMELIDQCTRKKQNLKKGLKGSVKTFAITWIISLILMVIVSLIVKYFGEIVFLIIVLAAVFYVPETVLVIIF